MYGHQVALVVTLDVEKSENVNIDKEDWIFISINNVKADCLYKDVFINNNNKILESSQRRSIDYLYKTALEKVYQLSSLEFDSESNRFLSKYFKSIEERVNSKLDMQKEFILLRLITTDMRSEEFKYLTKDKNLFTSILTGNLK